MIAQRPKSITSKVETITPALAELYLRRNTKNRNLRKGHVDDLVRDMRSGRYIMNGDTIRFSKSGTLIDGQHRLTAICISGIPQDIVVVRGLEEEAMRTIDAGVKRTSGDRITLSGQKYGNYIAATISVLGSIANRTLRVRMTGSETLDILNEHPALPDSVARAAGSRALVSPAYIAAFHYIGLYTGYTEQADEFLETLRSGMPVGQEDPAWALRERLIKMKSRNSETKSRSEVMGLFSVAWEAKRINRGMSLIRARRNGDLVFAEGWGKEDLFGPELV